jgi:hypothetical protein
VLNIKCMFHFHLPFLFEIFFALIRAEQVTFEIHAEMHVDRYVKCP